jgi:hypothetical protein
MSLPPELASNVEGFLQPCQLETPGAVVVGSDHVARAGDSTYREIRACVFDAPGKRTDKGSGQGQIAGARTILGYALVNVQPAIGLGDVRPGDRLHWLGDVFEISESSRWGGADGMMGPVENSETFFEFRGARVTVR